MLFASSRLSLVRELGIERFRETIFATKEEELTKEGFERHDKHVKLAAPLTEEERGLEGVKRAEMEEGRGMGERRSMVRSGVTMEAGDGVREALEGLKIEGGKNLVQLVGSKSWGDRKMGLMRTESTDNRRKSTSRRNN